ncbi:MAG: serine/threonine protein kinase [Planctomycetes bacterium]|nr:serine/threonine protein kinase [Planctomycetota bacterium]
MPNLTAEETIRFLAAKGFLSPGEVELVNGRYRETHDGPLLGFLGREKILPHEVVKDLSLLLSDGRMDGHDPHLPGLMLLSLIGRGGRGSVFRAWQPSLKRLVAVKILSRELATNREYIQRFLREARVASKVAHKNIVRAFDINKVDGNVYLVMEYVSGQSLGDVLRLKGKLSVAYGLEIARQVAEALSYAAGVGLVHRDIKPDNIMIDRHGRVKLCDLGLARTVGSTHLTSPLIAQGTPAYMSPEAATAPEIDSQTDVYSLGATLYRALLGRLPFDHSDPVEVLRMHVEEEVRGLDSGEIPGAVGELIRRMMQKDPKKRPQAKALPSEIAALAKALPGLDNPKLWTLVEGGEPPPVVAAPQPSVAEPTEQIPDGLSRVDAKELPRPVVSGRMPAAPTPTAPVAAGGSRMVMVSFGVMTLALAMCLVYIMVSSLAPPPAPVADPQAETWRKQAVEGQQRAESAERKRAALAASMADAAARLSAEDARDAERARSGSRRETVDGVMSGIEHLRKATALKDMPGGD